jgi:hypothetical protein
VAFEFCVAEVVAHFQQRNLVGRDADATREQMRRGQELGVDGASLTRRQGFPSGRLEGLADFSELDPKLNAIRIIHNEQGSGRPADGRESHNDEFLDQEVVIPLLVSWIK